MDIAQFVEKNGDWMMVLGVSSAVFFVGSVLLIPLIVAYLPADFFVRDPMAMNWSNPGVILLKFAKNLLGVLLVLAGVLMLFLPGQGLLSILLGISLLDFPAKRRWQLALVRRKSIHQSIDWIRNKMNRPQLEIPERAES